MPCGNHDGITDAPTSKHIAWFNENVKPRELVNWSAEANPMTLTRTPKLFGDLLEFDHRLRRFHRLKNSPNGI
jgi:hypothetical protein